MDIFYRSKSICFVNILWSVIPVSRELGKTLPVSPTFLSLNGCLPWMEMYLSPSLFSPDAVALPPQMVASWKLKTNRVLHPTLGGREERGLHHQSHPSVLLTLSVNQTLPY